MYPISDVHFADANGSSIAYMMYGSGPPTICAVPPMAQNIEMAWEVPRIRAMFDRFAAFSQQVMFDKRGTGMSDRSLDIPSLDERVDELKAVMDHAGVERAYLHGVSEGGPMAMMFAATYPERVDGLILEGTGATLQSDEMAEQMREPGERTAREEGWRAFAKAFGTPESMTPMLFAPSLLADEEFTKSWPRYERQSANRDALPTLFRMNFEMDAREVLDRIDVPVLILHRRDDMIVHFDRAEETHQLLKEAGADVTFVELEGRDHFTFALDIEPVAEAIEKFTTGDVKERPRRSMKAQVQITTLGRFEVLVDTQTVPNNAWGSKRARSLLKRLVTARGWPVSRDELIDLLWPDDDSDRLSARLSVQLSGVRRVLHGAVIANRETVRLDLDAVDVDIEQWDTLTDDDAIVAGYQGEFLPEERFEDWTTATRDELRRRFIDAAHRVAARSLEAGDSASAEAILRRVLEADRYDDAAHTGLVRVLHRDGKLSDARRAYESYATEMSELGVAPRDFEEIT